MAKIPDKKIIDTDVVSAEIGLALSEYMRDNWVLLQEVADKMWSSYSYWSRVLNGKVTTNNEEVYERLATAIWMPMSEFREIVRRAKSKAVGTPSNSDYEAAFRSKHGISDDDKWRLVQGFIDMITKSDK